MAEPDPLRNLWAVRECYLRSLSPEADRVTALIEINMVGSNENIVATLNFQIPLPGDLDNISGITHKAEGEIVDLCRALEAWFDGPIGRVELWQYPEEASKSPNPGT